MAGALDFVVVYKFSSATRYLCDSNAALNSWMPCGRRGAERKRRETARDGEEHSFLVLADICRNLSSSASADSRSHLQRKPALSRDAEYDAEYPLFTPATWKTGRKTKL